MRSSKARLVCGLVAAVVASAGCASSARPHVPSVQPTLAGTDAADAVTAGHVPAPTSSSPGPRPALAVLTGRASYYSDALAGRPTASGEPYEPTDLIAAHPDLPFGTLLRVTNVANGRWVEVHVVDRGPFAYGRVLDLSRRAAEELDMIQAGHVEVMIEVLEYGG